MGHGRLVSSPCPPAPWPPARVCVPPRPVPPCPILPWAGGSEGKGAMGGGGGKRTSQPGTTPESDICQTPMLLLIKSGGQFAARRHPCFPHLPAAGAEPQPLAPEAFPPAPPGLSWQPVTSFPFWTWHTAEQRGKGHNH